MEKRIHLFSPVRRLSGAFPPPLFSILHRLPFVPEQLDPDSEESAENKMCRKAAAGKGDTEATELIVGEQKKRPGK